MYTEYIIYTSCRIIREASTRVNIPAVKAAQEFEIHDKPVEQACPEDTTGCTEMGTGKNDHMFFCLNLRSYGKSPFLNMVNQRWLAGKSLEVNNYAGYSCENHLFSWAMTSIANCWIARGYVLHQNWGMAPEVKKLSIPSQSTVAGGSCRGDQLWDTSRFFIIWNMPSGHTHMILLPPSLHGRSGFPR